MDELQEGRWLGGVVAVEEIIGASEQAAIGVRRIVAYRDGFQLDAVARIRRPERRCRRRFLMSHGIMLRATATATATRMAPWLRTWSGSGCSSPMAAK